ncbi:hypothetical protein C8J57DRAFT_1479199 [Mycena rebaudengoi]|nr:hypothetical protein C8J57DRAFT_1479199 [Mycena rebaudengoi]
MQELGISGGNSENSCLLLMQDSQTSMPMKRVPCSKLGVLCLLLHIGLVVLHLTLLVIWVMHLEHKGVFPLDMQSNLKLITTLTTTAFGIKLALSYNFHKDGTLTAMHDITSAWAGIGSALATLYNQMSLAGSVVGTLSVVGYLGGISILHVTTPSLLSIETFNQSVLSNVQTLGSPQFNASDASDDDSTYAWLLKTSGFVPWIGNLDESQTLGLFNGSIYDVLQDVFPAGKPAQVTAVGYNITCGYLEGVNTDVKTDKKGIATWNISFPQSGTLVHLLSTGPNVIATPYNDSNPDDLLFQNDTLILFTTNVVVDSQGRTGSPVVLKRGMGPNSTVSHVQFLRCTKSIVPQVAMVDSQSGKIIGSTLQPNIFKINSTWQNYTGVSFSPEEAALVGGVSWSDIMRESDETNIGTNFNQSTNFILSTVEEYLMERLKFDPSWLISGVVADPVPVVALHEIENALSALAATILWTAGHIVPDPLGLKYPEIFSDGVIMIDNVRPDLQQRFTVVQTVTPASRLNVVDPTDLNLRVAGLVPIQRWRGVSSVQKSSYVGSYAEPGRHGKTEMEQDSNGSLENLNLKSYVAETSQNSSPALQRTVDLVLHSILLVVHLVLFGLCIAGKTDYELGLSVNLQPTASVLVTVLATACGTIYLVALVYITQKLAIRRDFLRKRTLTANHDSTSSWTGLGSALSVLRSQFKVSTSVPGILSIVSYLGAISLLQLTIPAAFSIETFNLAVSSMTPTTGLPEWSSSNHRSNILFMQKTVPFLMRMGNFAESQTLGLLNSSLYETLDERFPTGGPTEVSAVGMNISCGFLRSNNTRIEEANWFFSFESSTGKHRQELALKATGTNIIASRFTGSEGDSMIFYTTNRVVDSANRTGSRVKLQKPMGPNSTITHLQFFKCTTTLIPQRGKVDSQSGKLIVGSLEPSVHKTSSTWSAYPVHSASPQQIIGTQLMRETTALFKLEDFWFGQSENLNNGQEVNTIPLTYEGLDFMPMTFVNQYLMDLLYLDPTWEMSHVDLTQGSLLNLHDIENALAVEVASMFWIGLYTNTTNAGGGIPALTSGNAVVLHTRLAARLHISKISVSIGAAASAILLVLAVKFCRHAGGPNTSLNGTGLLHMMWLFKDHPDLAEQLERMDNPTDANLRAAGMIRVQLLGTRAINEIHKHGPTLLHSAALSLEPPSRRSCLASTSSPPPLVPVALPPLIRRSLPTLPKLFQLLTSPQLAGASSPSRTVSAPY